MSGKKAAVIGVGFMGGSLALALRDKFPDFVVWGYARSRASYLRIKQAGVVHKIERDLKKVVEDADFVILALPVLEIREYLKNIAKFLKKGAIVFDLGSSKELIENAAERYLPDSVSFVGCHPLCGGEKGGVEFSSRCLYAGSHCIITTPSKIKAALIVKKLWQKLGVKVTFMAPNLHDRILCSVSHLPHLVSFSITDFIPAAYWKFSPQSLKDLTRISDSPSCVWADIFLSNKENLSKDLRCFIKALKKFESILKKGDKKDLLRLIEKVNKKHKKLSEI